MDDRLADDISGWLMALSTLVAGKLNLDEIRLRLSSYVPLLAEEFPNTRYFTSQSLRSVARHSKWFPSYGELCDLLSASWKESRTDLAIEYRPIPRESTEPYPIQLPPPERESRHFRSMKEISIRPPERTVEQQLAILRGDT